MKSFSERASRTWILVLTSIAACMITLDALVITTALSTIRLYFGASIEELEWTVNAYTLTFAVLMLMGAALGDRFGRRRMFVIGLGLFIAASAACALAPNISWLIAARAVQGCGAALVMPLALTLLSVAFPPEIRGRALGIFGSVTGLSLIVGPVVGGAIAGGLAWEWIFWLNVPLGLIVIPLALRFIPESFGPRTRLDIGGLLSISGATLGLVWGLIRGNSAGWGSFEVIGALLAGCALTVLFVLWELRASAPMVPLRFFRSRAFSAGNAVGFLLTASVTGTLFFMAQFLQTAQGYGPLGAGLRLLPWTAILFVVSPITGNLITRVGERRLIVCGQMLQAIGLAWIGLIASPQLPYTALITPMLIAGCGASLVIPTMQSVVINAVTAHEIGKASGTFSMLRQLGGAFGVSIVAAGFALFGNFHSPQAFSNGFAPAIGVASALALVGAIIGLLLPAMRTVARNQARLPESEPKPGAVTEGVASL